MSEQSKRAIYGFLALAILVVVPLYAVKVYLKTDYTDFFVYYRSALRAKNGEWNLVYTFKDGASPFRYAPILLPLFRPFAELSLRGAQLLWYFFQCLCFALGFAVLFRAGRTISPERAGIAAVLSFFYILRFCLDCFTIGQVSSLMFLGYCLGLAGYIVGDYFTSGSGIFIPTLFKIGPGISFLLYPFSKLEEWMRAWLAPLIWTVALSLITLLLVGGRSIFRLLCSRWLMMVRGDDTYYDASHYGSQSLKSFLLRLSHTGLIDSHAAHVIWFAGGVLGCAAVFWIWTTRRALSSEGKGLLFALGVFPYLWFMPETFKYSLTALALPVFMLFISKHRTRLATASLVIGFFVLSAAGKDLMPDWLFFGLQRASFPFFATLLIGAAVIQSVWRHTLHWTEVPRPLPRPWKELPVEARSDGLSVLIPLSEALPSRSSLEIVVELQRALERRFGSQWEMIWIAPAHPVDPRQTAKLRELVAKFPQSKLVFASETGRGYALRTGFLASTGKWIYLYRIEQPVNVAFFEQAMDRLQSGHDLVRANRRDPQTRFLIPVKYLRLAYRRHRLGLYFNRLVRWMLPEVKTSDTHSGHVIMSRSSALQIFALQTHGDFLFDLELCAIARAHGFRESELPVKLYLFEEKSGERILSEVLSILTGLPRLRARDRKGCMKPLKNAKAITADDWGLSPAVNQGILELARRGVVHRVSLMANTRYLTEGLDELKSVPGIQLGMHFTLTYGRALHPDYAPRPPAQLLCDWLNPVSNRSRLRSSISHELAAQLQKLKDAGVSIQYFDGHHHIHLIPGLLDVLAPQLQSAGIRTVRVPYDPELRFSRKFPLVILSLLVQGSVRRNGFESLRVFYPQRAHFMDHGLMRAKMNRNPSAEVIVHPATHNDIDQLEFPDSYTEGRVDEFRALRMLSLVRRTT